MQAEAAAGTPAAVRVLAIADTDSYLKWSAATLEALPSSWECTQLIIENPVMPSRYHRSPVVYLRRPIRKRDPRTFAHIGRSRGAGLFEPSPECIVPPGSPRGMTPRL